MVARNRTLFALLATTAEATKLKDPTMINARELCAVFCLFVLVIVFQMYVYVLLDVREFETDMLDDEHREAERRRRQDVLLKALNAM